MQDLRLTATLVIGFTLVAAATSIPAGPAHAETCATDPVTTRGEPASFEWLARTKARANWRRKVRATPDLGTQYSTWSKAKNAEERCLTGPEGTVCVFSAVPCAP